MARTEQSGGEPRDIDYIYAKARLYCKENGEWDLKVQKEDTKEDNADAQAEKASGILGSAPKWAIGNHTFKESGYKDIYQENEVFKDND